jgi:hypothetical protein
MTAATRETGTRLCCGDVVTVMIYVEDSEASGANLLNSNFHSYTVALLCLAPSYADEAVSLAHDLRHVDGLTTFSPDPRLRDNWHSRSE